jgi:serine protease
MPRLACAPAVALLSLSLSAQGLSPARPQHGLLVGGFVNGSEPKAELTRDRILVRLAAAVDGETLRASAASVGLEVAGRGGNGAFEVLRCDPALTEAWIQWLGEQPGVVYAERDPLAHTETAPNDPFYAPYQWNFYNAGTLSNGHASNFGVQAEAAWASTTGAGVTVAVVDTGIAYENYGAFAQAPDLAGRTFVSPYDAVTGDGHANDENCHGTHVAGTIGQSTNNGIGTAGIAYNCALMPVRVLDASGSGTYAWIASGITWAADHGANVINMSLGGTTGSTTLQNAVIYANAHDVTICAAAGNSGHNGISFPARYTQCIAVGATRFDGTRARYSSYGSGIDVVAPGGDTSVDQNGDGYGDGILQQTFAQGSPTQFAYYFFQGTSMATPHVSAIAALVKSLHPAYTNAQVRNAIESSCRDLGAPGYDTTYGNGLVNAAAAITH